MPLPVTDRASKILAIARDAAHEAGIQEFGAEFALRGIVYFGVQCIAVELLRQCGLNLEQAMKDFGVRPPEASNTTCRPSAMFLELAEAEALELKDDFVGTEHLLLAASHAPSSASSYLERHQITHDKLLDKLKEVR